jgi:cytochrome bd-type quinol oxidase subunit 2
MAETSTLTNVWAAILAFAVFMYVVMDGFDLGIGILFPGFAVGRERDTAMNSIAPVWDGNETWLVLGGGGLLAAFPLAYSIVLSAPVHAAHSDAARARVPRRRLRISLARSGPSRDLGFRLHRRLVS